MSYSTFPLFQSHLDLAHHYWKTLIKKGDSVIDATCGNGQDTLKLATLALSENAGKLWGLDIQQKALDNTRRVLDENLPQEAVARVSLTAQNHSSFPSDIPAGSVKLIVYNLGYLPGGDKTITTRADSTLDSLASAQKLICPGGAISITCYPGHAEGAIEQRLILDLLAKWPPQKWSCTYHQWLNRRQAPSLLLVQSVQIHTVEQPAL